MVDSASERPLPAQARQQLLTIAADVMGRSPLADLPPSLRRFARFAPAKRIRLGGTEIAAALATEESFRQQVGDVVRETSPELAEQVMTGHPPETADPADLAVVTYLLRPEGWQESLAHLAARLEQEDLSRAVDAELSRLQAEHDRLVAAHAALVREREQARTAERQGAVEREREIAELRREIRRLRGEVRAANRSAEHAQGELARARGEADLQRSSDSAELRRLQARISELEADLQVARRAARAEREHDMARLWLLVETMQAALAGLRRELDVAEPSVRPADLVEAGAANLAARPSSVDGPLLDRLLDMGALHLIVDGYNLTKTGYGTLPLADQRARLVSSLGALAARTAAEVTVAFDGTAAPLGAAGIPTPRGVRVLFSPTGTLADDLIRQLLRAEPPGRLVLVASSDREVAASAREAGAWSVPAAVLLKRLERS